MWFTKFSESLFFSSRKVRGFPSCFISGDVQFGRTDLGFGNTFIMSELWGLMDTTSYYNYDGWCFLMAKPQPPANWLGKKLGSQIEGR